MSGGHSNRNKRGGGARPRHGPPRQTGGRSAHSGNGGSSSKNIVSIPANTSNTLSTPSTLPAAGDQAASPVRAQGSTANNGVNNGTGSGQNNMRNGTQATLAGKAATASSPPLVIRPPQPPQIAPTHRTPQAAPSLPTIHRPTPQQAPRERTDANETAPEASTPTAAFTEAFVVEPIQGERQDERQDEHQGERQGRKQIVTSPAAPRPRFGGYYAPGQNGRNNQHGGQTVQNGQHVQYAANGHATQHGAAGPTGLSSPQMSHELVTPPRQPHRAGSNGSSGANGSTDANGVNGVNGVNSHMQPPLSAERMRDEDDDIVISPAPRGEVGKLIDALHTIFEQDRAISSQGTNQRCGICYLHYPASDLEYRESEGFYVCPICKRSLGNSRLMMVRRQQR
ncbi:MAG: hypothetical protein ABI068_02905 [Ktedonobacterales bacterium]